jgi:hypothetical protein
MRFLLLILCIAAQHFGNFPRRRGHQSPHFKERCCCGQGVLIISLMCCSDDFRLQNVNSSKSGNGAQGKSNSSANLNSSVFPSPCPPLCRHSSPQVQTQLPKRYFCTTARTWTRWQKTPQGLARTFLGFVVLYRIRRISCFSCHLTSTLSVLPLQ